MPADPKYGLFVTVIVLACCLLLLLLHFIIIIRLRKAYCMVQTPCAYVYY